MATYYINADTGSDSTGTGTALLPWKTIQYGYTHSTNGDTLILQKATAYYTPPGAVTWGANGLSSRYVSAAEFGDAYVGNVSGDYLWSLTGTYTFTNIIFKNILTTTADGWQAGWIAAVEVGANSSHSYFTFTNCKFENIVLGNTYPNYIGIIGGTYYGYAHITFNRCVFSSMGNYLFSNGGHSGNEFTFNNCTIYYTTAAAGYVMFSGIGSMVVTSKNSIFVSSTPIALKPAIVTIWTTSYSCYNGSWTSLPTLGTGDITGDPLFVDPANNNFNLRPTSPCINTGTLI